MHDIVSYFILIYFSLMLINKYYMCKTTVKVFILAMLSNLLICVIICTAFDINNIYIFKLISLVILLSYIFHDYFFLPYFANYVGYYLFIIICIYQIVSPYCLLTHFVRA